MFIFKKNNLKFLANSEIQEKVSDRGKSNAISVCKQDSDCLNNGRCNHKTGICKVNILTKITCFLLPIEILF